MKLWTLIDLEAQLLKDRAEDRAALKARDRKIGQALSADLRTMDPEDPQDRQALFTCWLDAARAEADGPTLGERLESGQRLLSAALITLGGVLGISAASVVLHFNGVAPINAIHFLALFVFLPLGLLSLYPLTTWLWRKDLFEEDLLGLHQALRWLRDWMGRRIFKWAADSSEARAHIALQRRLKALGALYADVERWHLVDLANRFGVAFYACAFLTGLYLITFSDLAFGWSTTLDISAEGFRGLLKWLAWPWGFLGLPSEEMIEQTRHYRAQHTGATPLSKEALKMMGGWWPFLLTSLFVYGLLPRIGLLIWARRRGAKLLAAMRLNHGDFQALYERLAFEELIVCAPEPEGPAPTQRPVPVVIAARSSRKFQIREAEPEEIAASAPEPAPRQEIPEAAPLERVVPQVIRAPHARPEKRQGQHIEIIEPAPVLDPAPEPLIEPVIEPVAAPEPVPEPVIEPVAAPEPVPEPVIEPVAAPEPVPEPVIELVIEPVAAPEPVPEPVIEPVAAPEPVPEPVIEPVAAPEPVPEPVIEPVAAPEPVPEPVIEPVAAPEPVPEPVIEPVIEPVAAPEPVPEPIIAPEPIPEPVPEPIIAPKPEEPAPDLVIKTEPITAPLSESRPSLIGSKFKPIKSALGSLKPAAFPFKFSNNSPNLTPPSSSPAKKTPLKPASEPPKALPEPPKPAPEPPKALPEPPKPAPEPPKALPEPPKPAPEPPKPAPEPPKPAPEPPKPAPKVLSEPPKPAPEPPKALPEPPKALPEPPKPAPAPPKPAPKVLSEPPKPAPKVLSEPPKPAPAPPKAPKRGRVLREGVALLWADIPMSPEETSDLLFARLGWGITHILEAGVDDFEVDEEIQEILGGLTDGNLRGVVIVAESFEAPTLEVVEFIQEIRALIGAERPIVVGLVDQDAAGAWAAPSALDWEVWGHQLDALADPFLRLERLVEDS